MLKIVFIELYTVLGLVVFVCYYVNDLLCHRRDPSCSPVTAILETIAPLSSTGCTRYVSVFIYRTREGLG